MCVMEEGIGNNGPFDTEKRGNFAERDSVLELGNVVDGKESLNTKLKNRKKTMMNKRTSSYFSIRSFETSICSRVSLFKCSAERT